jgi:hypothetical protein
MGALLFGFVVGLVVGWNFIAQPVWFAEFLNKIKEKLFNLANK